MAKKALTKEEKELKKLTRLELLELLHEQSKETEALRRQLAEAKAALEEKKLVMEQSGSIAEAAIKLSGVFEAAQRAADLYLVSIGAKPQTKSADTEKSTSGEAANVEKDAKNETKE